MLPLWPGILAHETMGVQTWEAGHRHLRFWALSGLFHHIAQPARHDKKNMSIGAFSSGNPFGPTAKTSWVGQCATVLLA